MAECRDAGAMRFDPAVSGLPFPAPAPNSSLPVSAMNLRLLVVLTLGLYASHAVSAEPRTIHLLTVGNSFSHNATHYLGDIAKANGDTLVLREDNIGGSSFDVHLKRIDIAEKDPKSKLGTYTEGRTLKNDLTQEKWDFITIQQASIKSHDVKTYQPYAQQLAGFIRKHAPDATLLIHQTWEYRVDDPRFSLKAPKPGEPKTQEEMYVGLKSAYNTVAKELGVKQIPVGDAFHAANRDPQWGYQVPVTSFDSKKALPGQLPDQTHSLNVGWNWKKQAEGKIKLIMDGHHANLAGEYLGACVWYEVLFGRSVEGNAFVPEGLDPKYAAFLQTTAHRVVQSAN